MGLLTQPFNQEKKKIPGFNVTMEKQIVENILRKGENFGHLNFVPFPTMFYTLSRSSLINSAIFKAVPYLKSSLICTLKY